MTHPFPEKPSVTVHLPAAVGRPIRALLVAALVVLALVACGADDGSSSATTEPAATSPAPTPAATDPAPLRGEITVAAAASLRDAFTEIGDRFQADHPDVELTFTFDSSSTLATQIIEGAPADVYASADEANLARLVDEDLVSGDPAVFARNGLVIVTKPGNPEGIEGLADLAEVTDAGGVISLCGEEVPCGRYAAEALTLAGVAIPEDRVTRGQNVSATLTAVTEGDAVAAVVYVSDAVAAGEAVTTVAVPEQYDVIAVYPVGIVAGTAHPDVARAFVDLVLGAEGQAILADHGFLPPP